MLTATGLVLEQQSACSAGAQSLLVDYVQFGTAYLTRPLNDDGKLGAVTKAMLKAQASRLGRLKSSQIGPWAPGQIQAHAATGADQVHVS